MSGTKKLVTVAAEALGLIAVILFTWAVGTHDVELAGLGSWLAMGAAAIAEKKHRAIFPRTKRKPRWAIVCIGIGAFCVLLASGLFFRQNKDLLMAGFTLAFTV